MSLRQRGYGWTEIADAFDLGDEYEARQLACSYLLSVAARRQAGQEGAGEGNASTVTDAPADSDNVPAAIG